MSTSRQKRFKPEQRIVVNLRSWTMGTIEKTGNDYVRVIFDNYISWQGFLTPKTIQKTMETLETMGFKGTDLSQLKHNDALDESKEYIAVIGEEREYNGKYYYNADWINGAPTIGFSADTPKDLVDKFAKYDSRAYIADTQDMESPAASQDWSTPAEDINKSTSESFASEDIPF